ncbi:E3 SUMO-protein ligase ZBED1-like isoform X4 [Solenopsis invicta]|uniref:E3 SUMO-protein ligase ZBED1-like isoform X4 n=2 Tax=Solenopsis invicta TaxID=13686 RepID=UPI00193CEA9E|nr:E3 SUMO-protein ligase ZBED1-like isoform X4 [Solenopsis invicta]
MFYGYATTISSYYIIQNMSVATKKKSEIWEFFTKNGSNTCICNLCGKVYKTGGAKKSKIVETEEIENEANFVDNDSFKIIEEGQSSHSEISGLLVDRFETVENNVHNSDVNYISTPASLKNKISHYDSSDSKSSSSSNLTQPSIEKSFKNQRSYEPGGTRECEITQSLLYMICKDNLPLSCTEKEGMKKFLNTAIPLYKAPSRKTITSLIENKYISLQAIVRNKMSEVNKISITTDIATVMNATRSFIVLTAHYIDEEKKCMNAMCLGVKNLTPHHTAINICADLNEMLEHWNISKKSIVSVTTDNGANIVAGIKMLLAKENPETNIHVPCLAHNINLVVCKALGAIDDIVNIIDKVKQIVAYFKHSNVAQDNMRNEQKKDGKGDGTYLYLIQEVATRWNSTFYCLERFQLLSKYVGKILSCSTHKNAPPMVTPLELAIIEECLLLLRPFEAATKDISGEKYISGSLVIPLVHCVKTSLQRINVTNEITQKLKEELYKQTEKRLDSYEKNLLLSVATILDPRFKRIHFASPLNAANAIRYIKEQIRCQGALTPPRMETSLEKKDQEDSIWNIHEEVAAKYTTDPQSLENQGLPTELKLYLDQPILYRNHDPIQYWVERKSAFPATFPVAMKFLTILGASVPSERLVSTLNNVCSDHRSRLTPEHTNQLVFLGSIDNSYWRL